MAAPNPFCVQMGLGAPGPMGVRHMGAQWNSRGNGLVDRPPVCRPYGAESFFDAGIYKYVAPTGLGMVFASIRPEK